MSVILMSFLLDWNSCHCYYTEITSYVILMSLLLTKIRNSFGVALETEYWKQRIIVQIEFATHQCNFTIHIPQTWIISSIKNSLLIMCSYKLVLAITKHQTRNLKLDLLNCKWNSDSTQQTPKEEHNAP